MRLRFTGATATDSSFLTGSRVPLTLVWKTFRPHLVRLQPLSSSQRILRVHQRLCLFNKTEMASGIETTDKGDFDENDIPNWSPIFSG